MYFVLLLFSIYIEKVELLADQGGPSDWRTCAGDIKDLLQLSRSLERTLTGLAILSILLAKYSE